MGTDNTSSTGRARFPPTTLVQVFESRVSPLKFLPCGTGMVAKSWDFMERTRRSDGTSPNPSSSSMPYNLEVLFCPIPIFLCLAHPSLRCREGMGFYWGICASICRDRTDSSPISFLLVTLYFNLPTHPPTHHTLSARPSPSSLLLPNMAHRSQSRHARTFQSSRQGTAATSA